MLSSGQSTLIYGQSVTVVCVCACVHAFRAASEARENMEILTLGLGDWVDQYELRAITSDSYSATLINIPDYNLLPDYVNRLKMMLCNGTSQGHKCHLLSPARVCLFNVTPTLDASNYCCFYVQHPQTICHELNIAI